MVAGRGVCRLRNGCCLRPCNYRTNRTMRQPAPLFGISPATVCRVVQRLRPLLTLVSASKPVAGIDADSRPVGVGPAG